MDWLQRQRQTYCNYSAGVVIPECFNRESRNTSSSPTPGFPLKACGNDSLRVLGRGAEQLQLIAEFSELFKNVRIKR